MSEYLKNLFIVAVCTALCQIICEHTEVKKKGIYSGLKLICSLCICLSVFSIFLSDRAFGNLQDTVKNFENGESALSENFNNTDNGYIIDRTKTELENQFCEIIYRKTGIKPVHLSIQFNIQQNDNTKEVDFCGAEIVMPADTSETNLYFTELLTEGILGCSITLKREGQ